MNASTPLRPVITQKGRDYIPVVVGAMVEVVRRATKCVTSTLPHSLPLKVVYQAFTYNGFVNPRGPLVLIARNDWVNNGQGPGQLCLTASQGSVMTAPCDAASPTPQQQFYLGFR